MPFRRAGSLVVAVVSLAGAAGAQGPVGTGVSLSNNRDQNWDVGTGSTPAFVDAYFVTTPPSPPWATNVPGDYQWISFDFDASGAPASPYTFRTTFDLTGFDPSAVSLSYRCAVDNSLVAMRLNGVAVATSCPIWSLSGVQTISTGFAAGLNTWEFVVTGDNATDGLVVDVTNFTTRQVNTTVPEPGTWALLGTGLLGLAGLARRRRG